MIVTNDTYIIIIFIYYAENDLEFNYFPGSLKGPQHWGDLEPEWALCKTGKWQSPVDLCAGKMDTLPNSQALKIYYKPSHALIKNRGHDIQVCVLT